jgi:ABC-type Zn uptake system ZnuABC Zn-binding protein ZnuA
MRIIITAMALVAAVLFTGCAQRHAHRVVASLPAIESILADLTANTSIKVFNPVPRDVSLLELEEFLDKHGKLCDSIAFCDAVADLRSIIPQDAVYRALRKRNIRIVEIDCATPLDPNVTPVPLTRSAGDATPYVWLSASNCMKMAEIASKDLEKLFPRDSAAVCANLQVFKTSCFALKSKYESKFAAIRDFEAATMTRDFDYFLGDVNLYAAFRFPADEDSWSDTEKRDFFAQVKSGQIRTVIHRWKPTGRIGGVLDSCRVATAILCAGDPAMNSFDHGLCGLLERNYSILYEALKK